MANIEIDHGVPVPAPIRRATRYPFEQMGVGDSFSVAPSPEKMQELGRSKALQQVRASLIRAAKNYAARRPGIDVVVRKDPLNPDAVRCWFVEAGEDPNENLGAEVDDLDEDDEAEGEGEDEDDQSDAFLKDWA